MNTAMMPNIIRKKAKHLWPSVQTFAATVQRYSGAKLPVRVEHGHKIVGTVTKLWTELEGTTMWGSMQLNEEGAELIKSKRWCSPMFSLSKGKADSGSRLDLFEVSLVENGGLNGNLLYRAANEEAALTMAACNAAEAAKTEEDTCLGADCLQENEEGVVQLCCVFAASMWVSDTEPEAGTTLMTGMCCTGGPFVIVYMAQVMIV